MLKQLWKHYDLKTTNGNFMKLSIFGAYQTYSFTIKILLYQEEYKDTMLCSFIYVYISLDVLVYLLFKTT